MISRSIPVFSTSSRDPSGRITARKSGLSHAASPTGQCADAFQTSQAVWSLWPHVLGGLGSVGSGAEGRRLVPRQAAYLIGSHHISELALRLHLRSVLCMEAKGKGRRQRITVSIDPQLLKWVNSQVGVGKRFRSSAHAVEEAVAFYKQNAKL